MRLKHALLLGLYLAGCVAAPLYAASAADAPAGADVEVGAPIEGQYIVVLDDRATELLGASDVPAVASSLLDAVGGGELLNTYEHALEGFAVRLTALQAELMSRLPGVDWVEQDQVVRAIATQQGATWGLDRIDQTALPLDGQYVSPDSGGADVHVYIVDTGLRSSHNEFTGRVGDGRNFVASGGSLLFGGGSVDPDDTEDCNGHGTHVAGTASGSVYGAAKQSITYPVRVLDCNGSGSNSGVIDGVDWIAENHNAPAVANMSLGGGSSDALDEAVRGAVEAGVVFAVAAGNSDVDACNGSPNRVAEAITVGSTNSSDERSSFSNFGSCVDIFAPGSSITSAWYQSDDQTRTISGTSMASPHVAGAAALLRAKQPGATVEEIFDALLIDGTEGVLSNVGSGSPNLMLFVDPSDDGEPVDRAPTADFSAQCELLSCDFDASSSSDDDAISAYAWDFGDGNQGSGDLIAHSFAENGSYNVTLTVTDSAGQTDSLSQEITVDDGTSPCPECPTTYSGSLSEGQQALHPGSSGFSVSSTTLRGFLQGPAGADFDLFLEQRSCFLFCSWSTVASSDTSDADAEIATSVSGGTYRWRVGAESGSGDYELLTDPQ